MNSRFYCVIDVQCSTFLVYSIEVFACLSVWSTHWFPEMLRFECTFECKIETDRKSHSLIGISIKSAGLLPIICFMSFCRKPSLREHRKADSDQYTIPYIGWIRLRRPSIEPDPPHGSLLLSSVQPQVYGSSWLIERRWSTDRAQDGLWSDRFYSRLQQFVNLCFWLYITSNSKLTNINTTQC